MAPAGAVFSDEEFAVASWVPLGDRAWPKDGDIGRAKPGCKMRWGRVSADEGRGPINDGKEMGKVGDVFHGLDARDAGLELREPLAFAFAWACDEYKTPSKGLIYAIQICPAFEGPLFLGHAC